jgi:hypothetical protein
MRKNKPLLVLITTFITLLLYSGVTSAFPSNLDVAFAKVSSNIGHLDQTAGCFIIWSKGDLSSQNIFCRYELNKDKDFLRDDDNGINLSKIKLYPSSHLGNLTTQLEDWLKKQYPHESNSITSDEVIQIVMFMSNNKTNFKPDRRFFNGRKPQTLLIKDFLKDEGPNKYKAQPEKEFAYLVHRSIQNKLQEETINIEENNVISSNTLTNSPTTKLTAVITLDEIQNGIKQQKIYLIISAISIIIFAVFILVLFWFLLERYNKLEKKIVNLERDFSDNFSQIRSDMISELRKVSLQSRSDIQAELKNMHEVQDEFISSVVNNKDKITTQKN